MTPFVSRSLDFHNIVFCDIISVNVETAEKNRAIFCSPKRGRKKNMEIVRAMFCQVPKDPKQLSFTVLRSVTPPKGFPCCALGSHDLGKVAEHI